MQALEPRRDAARRLYEMLTQHYMVVFKGTLSPFDKDWDLEDHEEALDHDERLKELFRKFKSAEKYHCSSTTKSRVNVC